jgi:hypothetical protein
MAREDMIMMSGKEAQRLHIIQKAAERMIGQAEAAGILFLSVRQIRRIVRRIRAEGPGGIIHRSRGKPSNRRTDQAVQDAVIGLYRTRYKDFGPTLASEKLIEREGITVNDETLRLWLIRSGDWKKSRKHRRHRSWRERKAHPGQMLQMDGSHHAWLEDRGPFCVLMSYIDDATGRVFAHFYDHEGTHPAMDSFGRYAKKHGLPACVYLDKHAAYKSKGRPTIEDELADRMPKSQFERALAELGVEVIHANSPQAKGRIERLFRTFQDRLVKEMRLRGISSIEEANRFLQTYLPGYNRRFSAPPREKADLHRPVPAGTDLAGVLCLKNERTLRNDRTLVHNRKLYQIEENIFASTVTACDLLDGSLEMTHKGRTLHYHEITSRPKRQKEPVARTKRSTAHVPPPDHPWKRFNPGFIGRRKETPLEERKAEL